MPTMSVYESCLPAKEKTAGDLQKILLDINLHIFDTIFQKFDPGEAHFIIFFILHAYSDDSPWVILGVDWTDEKVAIAERLNIPEYLRSWLIELTNDDIRCVIVDYLDYQVKPDFKLLQLKQMQYAKISSMLIKGMKAKEGEDVDLNSLFDANKELDKLHQTIQKMEEDLRKRYQFFYIGIEEATKADSKTGNRFSGKVESSRWINVEA